jgi:hypothetical protein
LDDIYLDLGIKRSGFVTLSIPSLVAGLDGRCTYLVINV